MGPQDLSDHDVKLERSIYTSETLFDVLKPSILVWPTMAGQLLFAASSMGIIRSFKAVDDVESLHSTSLAQILRTVLFVSIRPSWH